MIQKAEHTSMSNFVRSGLSTLCWTLEYTIWTRCLKSIRKVFEHTISQLKRNRNCGMQNEGLPSRTVQMLRRLQGDFGTRCQRGQPKLGPIIECTRRLIKSCPNRFGIQTLDSFAYRDSSWWKPCFETTKGYHERYQRCVPPVYHWYTTGKPSVRPDLHFQIIQITQPTHQKRQIACNPCHRFFDRKAQNVRHPMFANRSDQSQTSFIIRYSLQFHESRNFETTFSIRKVFLLSIIIGR